MVQCDQCQVWFHLECVGLTEMDAKRLDDYFCPACVTMPADLTVHARPVQGAPFHLFCAFHSSLNSSEDTWTVKGKLASFNMAHFSLEDYDRLWFPERSVPSQYKPVREKRSSREVVREHTFESSLDLDHVLGTRWYFVYDNRLLIAAVPPIHFQLRKNTFVSRKRYHSSFVFMLFNRDFSPVTVLFAGLWTTIWTTRTRWSLRLSCFTLCTCHTTCTHGFGIRTRASSFAAGWLGRPRRRCYEGTFIACCVGFRFNLLHFFPTFLFSCLP